MSVAVRLAACAAALTLLAGAASGSVPAPRGPVRVEGHALADSRGPFLALGASYFTALWRYRHDRDRCHRDLAFLARQGFGYVRVLSMVGWYPAWEGREIAPVGFTARDGRRVDAWPDYWQCLAGLVDAAYDRYGLRTQITVFADAQLMPGRAERTGHLERVIRDVVAGREQKVILIEIANEAWQNGFPGPAGVAELRELAAMAARATRVPVAISSNHERAFEELYRGSEADIATWHFSRDRRPDNGWLPVYDCWAYGDLPGLPPVSSNEPIGPGSSVDAETDPLKLVMAAAFAYVARLPMYVFHSEAGAMGRSRFEETPGVGAYRRLAGLLPRDLPNWTRFDAGEPNAPLRVTGGSCVRLVGSRKGHRLVCVAIGVGREGVTIRAEEPLRFCRADPLTGARGPTLAVRAGGSITLDPGSGAWLLIGETGRPPRGGRQ